MSINLDRLVTAVGDHSGNLQRLLDLAKAQADAETELAPTVAKVDELSAYLEASTAAIKAFLDAKASGVAPAAVVLSEVPPAA
jgi:ABC-type transporter Mla subunit MlaD